MITAHKKELEIKCPSCSAEAIYRYGRARTGKQRYLCLICGSQFTFGIKRRATKEKLLCPECGKPMHLYKREMEIVRFRCSGYPECRTYKRIQLKEV